MRNTQFDSSVPRGRPRRVAPQMPDAGEEPVRVRTLPPILATLGAALFLMLLFGLMAFITTNIFFGILADGPGGAGFFTTAACGLVSVLLVGGALYFVYASTIAARDLGAAPKTREGRVLQKHTGRGRNGGHWIVVGPGEPDVGDRPAAPPAPVLAADPTVALPTAAASRDRGFVRGRGGSFGAQLQEISVGPRPADPAVAANVALPFRYRRLGPEDVNLRVDKHTYEALTPGDQVQVVYSPHLQHVYYVRKRTDDGTLVLRNPTLI